MKFLNIFTLVVTLAFCLYTRRINAIPTSALTNTKSSETPNKNYLQSTLLPHDPNKSATIPTETVHDAPNDEERRYDPTDEERRYDPTDEERPRRFIPTREIRHREIYRERPKLGIDVLRIYLDVLADLLERLHEIDERIPLERLSGLVGRKPDASPNRRLLGRILSGKVQTVKEQIR
ncbi:4651_t:CDS:1 [Ambispora gerdemannii]|uniref:4651_t:CDS:1 n=1 Tax=Ambispora gerdemannii TaxID=144530 RepID=A0A9N9ACU5_9GLOM|nr:4651_t:CDS:1 [Ambispora gerdemannii]